MVRAETITVTQVYTYNGDGFLVAQSIDGVETAFTWDQALALPQVLATSDGTLSVYGLERLAVVQGDTWHYPQHDALGSVRQWTDALGVVLATQAYSPFGVPRDPLGVAPWGFTGEWHDPMGMVYLRARWYNPALGRFTQVDPFPGLLSIPATRHPYVYGLNSPLTYNDASGRFPWVIVGTALVGAAVGYGAQVYRNVQAGMEFRAALTTNIDLKPILATAGAFGLGAIAVPALIGAGSQALLTTGLLTGSTVVWRAGMWGMGAAEAAAVTVYGLRSCTPQSDLLSTKSGSSGRLGGPVHRGIVKSISRDIKFRGLEPKGEFHVATPGGLKQERFVDVAGLDPATKLPVEFHQVGDLKSTGLPALREMQAILDILRHSEKYRDVPLYFWPKWW
jgi:RHS repeat-associated protein